MKNGKPLPHRAPSALSSPGSVLQVPGPSQATVLPLPSSAGHQLVEYSAEPQSIVAPLGARLTDAPIPSPPITWSKSVGYAGFALRIRVPSSCRPSSTVAGFPRAGSPEPTVYIKWVTSPRLSAAQEISWSVGEPALNRVAEWNSPPSVPANTQ